VAVVTPRKPLPTAALGGAGTAASPGGRETVAGPLPGEVPAREVDARSVRATIAASTRLEGDPSMTIEPAPDPATTLVGREVLSADDPIVDGVAVPARLERFDGDRGRLTLEDDGTPVRLPVVVGEARFDRARGTTVREVIVRGWRIEVEVEPERRAVLRERARRGAGAAAHGGPLEVHAIIPGRVVAVSVEAGETIEAGQQLLVVEAMKMQNELRAPREGRIDRVGVEVGQTIEVGDLLVVIT
jgi:biotin carboxyl carrier protein